MIATVSLCLNHALLECLTDALPRSAVSCPLDALLVGCARMRDWQQVAGFAELADVVGGVLRAWQGRLVEGMKQQDEGAKLDQQIGEDLRRLGYE